MRLFYFTSIDLTAIKGGCTSHVRGIAEGLWREGWVVTLFSSNRGAPQPSFPFRHILTKKRSYSLASRLLEQLSLAWKLFRGREGKPDAIYVRAASDLVAPILYARWYGIPYFVEVNTSPEFEGSPSSARLRVRLENWVLSHARAVFTVTEELKQYLVERTGLPEEKFEVMPNGCDASLCQESAGLADPAQDGAPTIGFLGAFQKWQGVETVLRAIPLLRKDASRVSFVLAGGGDLEGQYRSIASDLGICDCVSFPGFISGTEVPSFLRKCAVVVAPRVGAFRDDPVARCVGTSPLKMFTYLGCGRVVVTSDLPSLDMFRKCPAVRFAKADDPADYARAILQVLRMTPAQREELGRQGREFVLNGYTWDQIAKRTGEAMFRWCGRSHG